MERIGIVANPKHKKSKDILFALNHWLKKRNKRIFLEKDTAQIIGKKEYCLKSDIASMVELIIVLGGDGTLLSVARTIKKNNVPIVGVNLGFLGFLTALTLDVMYTALENVFNGLFDVEKRIILSVNTIRDGKIVDSHNAFNEVVLNRGELARIINLEITINGQYATKYRSDGLIISTPTGSTAYSLAAGGPIVYPTMNAIVISPICPHTLTNRPIVIPGDVAIDVLLNTKNEHVLLTLDGQEVYPVEYMDKINIKKADFNISLIQFPDKNHYSVLSKKLHWGK